MCRWKNYENRSIFSEDMDKSIVSPFLTHGVHVFCYTSVIISMPLSINIIEHKHSWNRVVACPICWSVHMCIVIKQLIGCIRWGGDHPKGRSNFGGEFGVSSCNQWGLCCIVVQEWHYWEYSATGESNRKCPALWETPIPGLCEKQARDRRLYYSRPWHWRRMKTMNRVYSVAYDRDSGYIHAV